MEDKDRKMIKGLGLTYQNESSLFKVFAPEVDLIVLALYKSDQTLERVTLEMSKDSSGVHSIKVSGDLKGQFYTYLVEDKEVTDPYSYAVSVNGIRSAIVDLSETDPLGFKEHVIPVHEKTKSVIYELHVKDFTYDKSSNAEHRGKYLGLVERGLMSNGMSVGIDHLIELGITHVHLMPIYDFVTVNEEEAYFNNDDNYNWGYDPEHYNAPEGSYARDPRDPVNRILELKTMIMKLHEANISVIMDAVYNHTYRGMNSNFNVLYPNYYYRLDSHGNFSDGSGCGNEFASEKPMASQFILDSLEFWVNEYKIDGFRFDLFALTDKDTVVSIVDRLQELNPNIMIYGEPWTGGLSSLPYNKLTLKGLQKNQGFAFFNDTFRDALKGDNDGHYGGFAQGHREGKANVIEGIRGSLANGHHSGFTENASESINYVNSHDNLILQDKLMRVSPYLTKEQYIRKNKFIFAVQFLAQGIPFIHAGNEFMRTKNMDNNSYKSGMAVNSIDWTLKEENKELFHFVKELIFFKRNCPQLNLDSRYEIEKKLKVLDTSSAEAVIVYTLEVIKDKQYYLIIFNGSSEDKILFTKAITKSIKAGYHVNFDDLKLMKIFGMKGFLTEDFNRWSPHGVITKPGSIAIWTVGIS